LIVPVFLLVLGFIANGLADRKPIVAEHANETVQASPVNPAEAERCKVPEFAKAMGHEEKWKLHNNCK